MTALVGIDALNALAESHAWKRGDLGHLLSRRQRRLLAKFRASRSRRYVAVWTRRGGKSWLLCGLGIEEAIRTPGMVIVYAAPTQVMAREIVLPLMRRLLEDAPKGLYTFSVQQMRWTFSNGSTISLAGCDGPNADRLRGRTANLAIIDEAGFVDDLTYVVESILRPQLITTKGRLIMASTPPVSPSHPFKNYAQVAEEVGAHDVCTIDDAEHISTEEREAAIEEAGGRGSTTCKREYYCEFIPDDGSAIVPEFHEHRARIVVPTERPVICDRYVAADFGFHDLTVVVFAYLDFDRAKLVVEDELVFRGKSALDVGDAVKRRERELWGGVAPTLRVADAPIMQLADLAQGSGVQFVPAAKVDAEAALNYLRRVIATHRLEINERCTTTIAHLHYGVWNKSRTSFDRSDSHGHYDAIDAVKYLVRHVDWRRAPIAPPPKPHDDLFVINAAKSRAQTLAEQLRRR